MGEGGRKGGKEKDRQRKKEMEGERRVGGKERDRERHGQRKRGLDKLKAMSIRDNGVRECIREAMNALQGHEMSLLRQAGAFAKALSGDWSDRWYWREPGAVIGQGRLPGAHVVLGGEAE